MKAIRHALLALWLFPVMAWSQTVAVLDIENAIRASKPADEFRAQIQQELSAEQEQLRKLSEQGNALKEKVEKEGDFLSQEERSRLMDQVKAKYQEFQQLGNRIKQQAQQREQAFLERLRPQVEEILEALVKERNIDLIMNKNSVIFVKPDLDLTREVVEKLNQQ